MKSLIVYFLIIFLVPAVGAEDGRKSISVEVDSKLASADLFINLRSGSGSVREESAKMMDGAISNVANAKLKPGDTPACQTPKTPSVVFESVPNKYLSEYDDRDKCQQKLQETSKVPIIVDNKRFGDLEALSDWVYEFSQGEGDDGEALYAQCDGACSPKYKYMIKKVDDSLTVKAVVICGHARDKDDNTYKLSTSYLWECEDAVTLKKN